MNGVAFNSRFGIDAILTNRPHKLHQKLHDSEFVSKFSLATPSDDPFDRIVGHGPYRVGCYRVKVPVFILHIIWGIIYIILVKAFLKDILILSDIIPSI